jgi:ABC-type microcin C transport system duplicated ATPase subunit YejF
MLLDYLGTLDLRRHLKRTITHFVSADRCTQAAVTRCLRASDTLSDVGLAAAAALSANSDFAGGDSQRLVRQREGEESISMGRTKHTG